MSHSLIDVTPWVSWWWTGASEPERCCIKLYGLFLCVVISVAAIAILSDWKTSWSSGSDVWLIDFFFLLRCCTSIHEDTLTLFLTAMLPTVCFASAILDYLMREEMETKQPLQKNCPYTTCSCDSDTYGKMENRTSVGTLNFSVFEGDILQFWEFCVLLKISLSKMEASQTGFPSNTQSIGYNRKTQLDPPLTSEMARFDIWDEVSWSQMLTALIELCPQSLICGQTDLMAAGCENPAIVFV